MHLPAPPSQFVTTNQALLTGLPTQPNQLSQTAPAGYQGKKPVFSANMNMKTTGEKNREAALSATRKAGLAETMRDAPKAPGLQKRARQAAFLTTVSPRQAVPSMSTVREPITQKVANPRPVPTETPTLATETLNTRIRDRDGSTMNLKQYPWPSDKPHTLANTTGQTRGEAGSHPISSHGRPHASDYRVRPEPRCVLPPGYQGHVPKIAINSSAVGKHFGDNTEEALLKRCVKHRNEQAIHLMPILYDHDPIPKDVTEYRKQQPVIGKDKEKAELQKTFGRTYRNGEDPMKWTGRGLDKAATMKTESIESNPPFPTYRRVNLDN